MARQTSAARNSRLSVHALLYQDRFTEGRLTELIDAQLASLTPVSD